MPAWVVVTLAAGEVAAGPFGVVIARSSWADPVVTNVPTKLPGSPEESINPAQPTAKDHWLAPVLRRGARSGLWLAAHAAPYRRPCPGLELGGGPPIWDGYQTRLDQFQAVEKAQDLGMAAEA